jgi:putative membrane protein
MTGLGAALTLGTIPAGAADKAPTKQHVAKQDAGFVKEAAQAGMAEVQGSRMALQKSKEQAVRDFAQRMVDDHTKAGDELKELAHKKNVAVPDKASQAQQKKIDSLRKVSGHEFDQRYSEFFGVPAHEEAVNLFEKEAKTGADADLRQFAEKTLPTLREHLRMAHGLQARTNAGGNTSRPGEKAS